MIYGYCRVSTNKQVISRQRENIIKKFSDAKIFEETYTGTTSDCPQWQKLLAVVVEGDTIVFDSVSRMSRNAAEGVKQYMELYDNSINLVFLNERYIDTERYKNALEGGIAEVGNTIADIYIKATNEVLMLLAKEQIILAFEQAEKEVKDLQKRTKDGMTAKGAGAKISESRTGKKYNTQKSRDIKNIIRKHSKSFGGTLTDKECITLVRCSSATYYLYKKELRSEQADGD